MAAERTRSFRINQFLVDPRTNTISGPEGVSRVPVQIMRLLVQLSLQPQNFISSRQLLLSAGNDRTVESSELPYLIRELLRHFGEDPGLSNLIVGSVDTGYKLCAAVIYFDKDSQSVVGDTSTEHDSGFDDFVNHLSDDGELKQTSSTPGDLLTPPVSETGWIASLSQRRVFRALGSYAVASWLIMQITALLAGAFPAIPTSATGTVTIALAIGFPIAITLAWLLQVTPQGVRIDVKPGTARKVDKARVTHYIDVFFIGVLLVTVAILSYDRYSSSKHDGVSVAVLAFINPDEAGDDRYLGVGISDDIRTRLAGVEKLQVAAPPSRELQSGDELSIKEIGERLMVDHVLSGSVRRSEDLVRLDVHLIDVSTGFSQWSKSYNATLEQILEVSSNISLYVASELEVILTQELRTSLADNPTEVPAAYEAYLEGRNYLELPRTSYSIGKSLLFFNESVAEDPSFALGYAGLCESFTALYIDSKDIRSVDLAEKNCRKALELNDELSQVHVALGNLFRLSGRLGDAEASFTNALELDENSLDAIIGLGDVYDGRGDFISAENQYRLAISELPNNWNGYNQLARFLLSRGRYLEAAENYRHVLAFMPNNVNAYNNLGATYFFLGDFAQAAEHYRRSLQLEPDEASYSNTGSMYYYAGNFSNAVAMYKKAVELSPKDYRVWGNLADAQRFDSSEHNEARNSYKQAIELAKSQLSVSPTDVETQSNLAFYLANTGDNDGAIVLLEHIALTSNLKPEYLYTMALTFRLVGDEKRSAQALSEAKIQGYSAVVLNATPELFSPDLIDSYMQSLNTGRINHE